jgi:hypothetical protein
MATFITTAVITSNPTTLLMNFLRKKFCLIFHCYYGEKTKTASGGAKYNVQGRTATQICCGWFICFTEGIFPLKLSDNAAVEFEKSTEWPTDSTHASPL